MRKKKWISSVAALTMAAMLFTGCGSAGGNHAAGDKAGKDAADKPQGKLTVYIGFQEDHAVAAIKKFTEDTGIEASMIRMSAGRSWPRFGPKRQSASGRLVWRAGRHVRASGKRGAAAALSIAGCRENRRKV